MRTAFPPPPGSSAAGRLAGELGASIALSALGGAALFWLLGGGRLLMAAEARAGAWALAPRGVGLGLSLALLLAAAPLYALARRVTYLATQRSAEAGPAGDAPLLAAAQRRLLRLPYVLAAAFLLAGAVGGTLVARQLAGLRTEDRVLAALLWDFSWALATLAVLLRLRSILARRVPMLLRRPGEPGEPGGWRLPLRIKLLAGFGWLLVCVTALSLLKHVVFLGGQGRLDGLATRGLIIALLVQIIAVGGVVALTIVTLAWPVRDLLQRASAVIGESRGSRGALQRPIVLGVGATAELHELQGLFEQLRRQLLSRLRTSTEQNLQLEAEVARRSAELSRRNAELGEALARLQSAREELLSAEKLATVGRIAAGITSEIDLPVARMGRSCEDLVAATDRLDAAAPSADAPPLAAALASLDGLSAAALRVRDIIRAMRVYVRPGETEAGRHEVLAVLADVSQLFSEPLQSALTITATTPAPAGSGSTIHAWAVRSDLALLLASWLAGVESRLTAGARVVASARVVGKADGAGLACELTIRDDGQLLSATELAAPMGGELLRRLGASIQVRSGPASGGATTAAAATATVPTVPTVPTVIDRPETVLTLTLPVAP